LCVKGKKERAKLCVCVHMCKKREYLLVRERESLCVKRRGGV
jgi:hypothetical protein